jgi:hypothetical protein
MYSNKKNKKKKKNNGEEPKDEFIPHSQNINSKKNFSSSSNKHIINSNNSSGKSNDNNIDNIDNNIEQINSFNKKKKKRDKKKSNRPPSINDYPEENNNNIKFLNNSNLTNANFNQNINNFNFKQKEPSNQQKLEEANAYMQQMNFIKAEKQYKSILENCGNYSSQFMINLLNNYSICLLNQRKFEESANYATKIILEYDNKNKRAYLTMLIILYNIKEYKKALELIERVNTLFKKPKDIEYFRSIINDINNAMNEDEDNKMREVYYNKEKKIVDLINNKWMHVGMYSIGTFLAGYMLFKIISNK